MRSFILFGEQIKVKCNQQMQSRFTKENADLMMMMVMIVMMINNV